MNRNNRFLSNFLIGYMVAAFGWWAIHLWRENDRTFATECKVLRLQHPEISSFESLQQNPEFQPVANRHAKRRRMIISEGLFFTICLCVGFIIVRRSSKKELSLARQRRNFLLSITHELKSPLAAIRLTLDTMARHELNRDQTKQLTTNGLRDAARLQNLVEDLLLAARLEDNWHPLPEPVDLATVLKESIISLKIRFPQAEIKVSIPENFAPVVADKSGLVSVIQNLLENSLKYSPAGAPVTFSAARNNGKLNIRVADTGKGIPNEEKKAVFEKFYRLGNEETRQTTGTGLGLYIVQQVVQAHGGSITIADNQPQGTIFEVEI